MLEEKIDYEKIGLKCGLEIHQQLDSRKLFCNCPSLLRKDGPDFEIKRKLHMVAGESGDVDMAAAYESDFKNEFIYQGYDTTCLVELDEEPPYNINKEALKIALHISLLMNCKIFSLTQIMRKTVIDGSNTSGFQRSVLIARDGFVETERGKILIQYVYLEEDAARKIFSNEEGKIIYRLDRLGVPLVEIVTAPDIKTPEQAKEVALHIEEILRVCKVRRGIGTIRQDINVSIKEHPRTEIKGFQDPKIFVRVVEKEVERQLNDLQTHKRELVSEVRGANPDATTKYLRPLPGAARMYPETDLPLLKISREMIDEAKRTLPKMKKEVEKKLDGILSMRSQDKEGLNREMINLLLKKNKIEEFKELLNIINNPSLIAKMILIYPKEISSHEKISLEKVEKILNIDSFENVLENLKKGKISESEIKHFLERIVRGENPKEILQAKKGGHHFIEEKIIKIIKEKPGLSMNAYMGLTMKELKGEISGKEASEIIKKHLK